MNISATNSRNERLKQMTQRWVNTGAVCDTGIGCHFYAFKLREQFKHPLVGTTHILRNHANFPSWWNNSLHVV